MKKRERVTRYVLEERGRVDGDKIALMDYERKITYQELNDVANKIGNGLLSLGVKRGDHVLIMLPNILEYVYVWLALCKIGAVEIPINTAYRGGILKYLVNNSEAKYLIIWKGYLDRLAAYQDEMQSLEQLIVLENKESGKTEVSDLKFAQSSFAKLLEGSSSSPDIGELNYNDIMAIMYTSGTTGPSKGVMVPYNQAYNYSIAWSETGFLTKEDIYYVTLPLFHIGGQWACVYASILAGATAIVPDGFHSTRFWKDIKEFKATITFLLGAMANFVLRPPISDSAGESTLRKVFMGPLISDVGKYKEEFNLRVATAFALTEATTVLFNDSDELKEGTCGVIRKGFDLRIANEFDEEIPVAEVGELLIRSTEPWTTMIGYYGMPEETVRAYRNQWLHTGDAMYKDNEGNYYFVDRIKDAIRRRGENISSFEVEKEVNSHPAVLESAAIAVKSEFAEDEIKIVVKLKEGQTLSPIDLIRYLEPRMPYFMVPRYVEFSHEIPKTPTQKIQKVELRKTGIDKAWDREKAGIKIKK